MLGAVDELAIWGVVAETDDPPGMGAGVRVKFMTEGKEVDRLTVVVEVVVVMRDDKGIWLT